MLLRTTKKVPIKKMPREENVTPHSLFMNRRAFLQSAAAAGLLSVPRTLLAGDDADTTTRYEDATSYNNYYEFSTDKKAVKHLAKEFMSSPWSVAVDGEVENAGTFSIDDINSLGLEERIYRFRCVEGWSMVVPWSGVPLQRLLSQARPTARARYVRFEALLDPQRFYNQRVTSALNWPYTEALTLTEAMHPLTLLATGMYGRPLPAQNGAPVRLIVPWKYGYKSIKAVVKITLVEQPTITTWAQASPKEYGFYANVNPNVPHPRWSQARELRLGELHKRPTLLFNGYADEVAGLYNGLDLAKNL